MVRGISSSAFPSGPYEERRLRHLSTVLVRGLQLADSPAEVLAPPATATSSLGLSFPSTSATPSRRPGTSRRSTSISSSPRGDTRTSSSSISTREDASSSSSEPQGKPFTSPSMRRSLSLRRSSTLTTQLDDDDEAGKLVSTGADAGPSSSSSSPASSRITLESPSGSRPIRKRTQSSASVASARSARSNATLRTRLDLDVEGQRERDPTESEPPSYIPRRAHSVADEKRHRLHSGWTKPSLQEAVASRMADCFVTLSFMDDVVPFYVTCISRSATNHAWGAREGTCQPRIEPSRDFATWSIEEDGEEEEEEEGVSEEQERPRSLDLGQVVVELWARGAGHTSPATRDGKGKGRDSGSSTREWTKIWGRKVDLMKLRKVSLDDERAPVLPPNSVILGLANLPPLAVQDDADEAKSKEGVSSAGRSKRKNSHLAASASSKTSYYLVTPPPFVNSRPTLNRRRSSRRKRHGRAVSSRRRRGDGANSDVETSRLDDGPESDDLASEPEMRRSNLGGYDVGSEDEDDQAVQVDLASSPQQQRRPRLQSALETKEVLELSLRETKMMPSYDLEEVRLLLQTQKELEMARQELRDVSLEVEDQMSEGDEHASKLRRSYMEEEVRRLSSLRDAEVESLKATRKALKERSEALSRRRARLETARRAQVALRGRLSKDEEHGKNLESRLGSVALKVHRRRIQLLHHLDFIYPIELHDAASLLFTIVGVPLPNGIASDASSLASYKHAAKGSSTSGKAGHPHLPIDESTISTAYGFVGQLIMLLSSYLSTPIPYPIAIAGSRGVILDPISVMSGPRTFPLYFVSGSVEPYRFEYGAFLLNKDLQHLMGLEGVSMVDVRHTLPNLKNLLVSLTSERTPRGWRGREMEKRREGTAGSKREVIALKSDEKILYPRDGTDGGEVGVGESAGANGDGEHHGEADGDMKFSHTEAGTSTMAAASGWTMSLLGWKSTPTPTTGPSTPSSTSLKPSTNGGAPGAGNGDATATATATQEGRVPTVRKLGGSTTTTARKGWLG